MALHMMITFGNIQSVCLLIIIDNRDDRIVSILFILLSHVLNEIIINSKEVCFWSRIVVLTIYVVFKNFLVWNCRHSTFNLTHILSELWQFRLISVHLILWKNGLTEVYLEILAWRHEPQVAANWDARIVLIIVSFEYFHWRHTLQYLMLVVVMSTIRSRCNIVIGEVCETVIRCQSKSLRDLILIWSLIFSSVDIADICLWHLGFLGRLHEGDVYTRASIYSFLQTGWPI